MRFLKVLARFLGKFWVSIVHHFGEVCISGDILFRWILWRGAILIQKIICAEDLRVKRIRFLMAIAYFKLVTVLSICRIDGCTLGFNFFREFSCDNLLVLWNYFLVLCPLLEQFLVHLDPLLCMIGDRIV